MTRLLHLDASARRDSFSRRLGAAFAREWEAAGGDRTYRDLAAEPVPQIDQAWTELCDHVLAHGITDVARYEEAVRTPAQAAAWSTVEPLLTEVVAADVVLIGTPMYNFSIPASLKAWIDQITFPRMSLRGRRFVVVCARGGSYAPGAPREPYDHQERYLRDFFSGHFAIDDPVFVSAELTNSLIDPALAHLRGAQAESYDSAVTTVRGLARELAREAA
ncbi:FMN-dependent NADH-azoreductase [Streptosporangium sp. NBC_01756]|uniref:FMN-dependent NADH-azoreductase n=1 Tax=Streptosporangium sp. NBC_01756 TaxID=2975950 RepID=UPI002DD803FE|nr:NAD(P)H-dependent oxidoreductase [Streptosporangium sp. NBC_01756]WSC83198.1 NAD(P)H-dependent oxidoreductase [Streptosporangium sp. NBC_01756]